MLENFIYTSSCIVKHVVGYYRVKLPKFSCTNMGRTIPLLSLQSAMFLSDISSIALVL